MSQSDEKNSENTEKKEKIGPGFSLTIAAWISYRDSKDDKDAKKEEPKTIEALPQPESPREHRVFTEKTWFGSPLQLICIMIAGFGGIVMAIVTAFIEMIFDAITGLKNLDGPYILILIVVSIYSICKIYKAQFHFVKRMQEEYWRNHGQ